MTPAPARRLFLKWTLLNAAAVVFLVVLGIHFHAHLHGAPLISIPIILLLGALGTAYAGRLCWDADSGGDAREIMHRAQYLDHFGWLCPMVGILSSIAGMSILLSSSDTLTLGTRVTSGGGAIFYGTFVGVLAMILLRHEHQMIEHELARPS